MKKKYDKGNVRLEDFSELSQENKKKLASFFTQYSNQMNNFFIPFKDKAFDVSILNLTLHHIPNNFKYFEEVVRVTDKKII